MKAPEKKTEIKKTANKNNPVKKSAVKQAEPKKSVKKPEVKKSSEKISAKKPAENSAVKKPEEKVSVRRSEPKKTVKEEKTHIAEKTGRTKKEYVSAKVPEKALKKDADNANAYHGEKKKHTEIEVYKHEGKRKELKTIEELKIDYVAVFKTDGAIYQKDIMASLDHLDLSDQDMEDLWNWFTAEKIKISEDDDIEVMDDNELDLLDDDEKTEDEEEDEENAEAEEEEEPTVVTSSHGRKTASLSTYAGKSSSIQLNDPVKMYLKEIGRVPLLKPEDEPEIAKRIEAGDEQAKNILISSNLRLVVSIAKKYVGRGML
ncbi:MAG: hypothetical protein EOM64_08295, partial [Erysipelotrichia bacterium]|nr:hypothetical protein [Erysipelotrichia bacterium]